MNEFPGNDRPRLDIRLSEGSASPAPARPAAGYLDSQCVITVNTAFPLVSTLEFATGSLLPAPERNPVEPLAMIGVTPRANEMRIQHR